MMSLVPIKRAFSGIRIRPCTLSYADGFTYEELGIPRPCFAMAEPDVPHCFGDHYQTARSFIREKLGYQQYILDQNGIIRITPAGINNPKSWTYKIENGKRVYKKSHDVLETRITAEAQLENLTSTCYQWHVYRLSRGLGPYDYSDPKHHITQIVSVTYPLGVDKGASIIFRYRSGHPSGSRCSEVFNDQLLIIAELKEFPYPVVWVDSMFDPANQERGKGGYPKLLKPRL